MADRGCHVEAVQPGPIPLDVAFSCAPGDVLAIFGPSGSGKTTILRTIAGLYTPAQARVRCGGQTWVDTSADVVLPAYRRAVGFVLQESALFPHLSALGNVMLGLGHLPRAARRPRAEALLDLVHLPAQAARRPRDLSGGERQRVALARALARDPDVLLLDEPFAAVDLRVRRRLQDELEGVRQGLQVPIVLVTHDLQDVVRLATHVLLLDSGRMLARGPVEELMSRPDLTVLRDGAGLGSVLNATVEAGDAARGLISLRSEAGMLLAPFRPLAAGRRVRIRIPAREVILATTPPAGVSLHNVLAGTVTAVHVEPDFDRVVVQMRTGGALLLAEVTRDAVERLTIVPGRPLHALIKSVSIDV